MPFIVGPGTIEASVLAGSRLGPIAGFLRITLALFAAVGAILIFKILHDYVVASNEKFLDRYTGIAGCVTALLTGSFAIELIIRGMANWWSVLKAS